MYIHTKKIYNIRRDSTGLYWYSEDCIRKDIYDKKFHLTPIYILKGHYSGLKLYI